MKKKIIFLLLTFSLLLCSRNVLADLINFYDFEKDDTVTILDSGFTAKITEDPNLSPVGLWGPDYTIPSNAIIYYSLIVPQHNEDYFDIYLGIGLSTIISIGGGYAENEQLNFSGSINLNSYGVSTGLAFVLSSGWPDGNDSCYDSKLIISNYPVPEPSTIILLGSGLLTIPILRKRLKTKR